jgi:hypothetical protein
MTEREKLTEVDTLITELRNAGMACPRTSGVLLHGDSLDRVLADCRRLVKVARRI